MKDYIVRATAAGAQIRAFAATTRNLVEEARKAHNTSPVMTAALGRLLTAGAMMGVMLKGEKDLLTLQIRGDGPGRGLTVTADSLGRVKGYPLAADVILPANSQGKLDVSGAMGSGILSVIRDMGMKEPYVGSVGLLWGEIAEDIALYFVESEQIPTACGLGVLVDRDQSVLSAGGYLVQLLPGAGEETAERLEASLRAAGPVTELLKADPDPEALLRAALPGLALEVLEKRPIAYRCDCSRERMERALISLGREELRAMIDEQGSAELTCRFCDNVQRFSREELEALLASC